MLGMPEQRAFERARHRARIGDVVAEIPSLVDAGDDEIGQAVEHLRDGDVDAVGRRAVDREDVRSAIVSSRSGRRSVSAWPIALASVDRRDDVTSPSARSASASA